MLDTKRLSTYKILTENGWKPNHKTDIKERYRKYNQSSLMPQVPIEEIFTAAREVIEALDGICIKNMHPELGFGEDSYAIEFGFFEYDESNIPELKIIEEQVGKRVLFIGIGYDIIGDWLIDEDGAIYFRDKIREHLHQISENIYNFLEGDIYKFKIQI